MNTITIDRIEGEFAIAECDGAFCRISLCELPEAVKEGDILRKDEDGYTIDADAVQKRRASLAARRRRMLGGN